MALRVEAVGPSDTSSRRGDASGLGVTGVSCFGGPGPGRILYGETTRHRGGVVGGQPLRAVTSAASEQPTQNWHDPGESDCLIKTKHCDGRKSVLTQCDFCPVL